MACRLLQLLSSLSSFSYVVSGSSWLEGDSARGWLEDGYELVLQLFLVAAVHWFAADLVVPAVPFGLLPSCGLVFDHRVSDPWTLANVRTLSCWRSVPDGLLSSGGSQSDA